MTTLISSPNTVMFGQQNRPNKHKDVTGLVHGLKCSHVSHQHQEGQVHGPHCNHGQEDLIQLGTSIKTHHDKTQDIKHATKKDTPIHFETPAKPKSGGLLSSLLEGLSAVVTWIKEFIGDVLSLLKGPVEEPHHHDHGHDHQSHHHDHNDQDHPGCNGHHHH
jgi:hypothetical protein